MCQSVTVVTFRSPTSSITMPPSARALCLQAEGRQGCFLDFVNASWAMSSSLLLVNGFVKVGPSCFKVIRRVFLWLAVVTSWVYLVWLFFTFLLLCYSCPALASSIVFWYGLVSWLDDSCSGTMSSYLLARLFMNFRSFESCVWFHCERSLYIIGWCSRVRLVVHSKIIGSVSMIKITPLDLWTIIPTT